jgi:hypothetical protein
MENRNEQAAFTLTLSEQGEVIILVGADRINRSKRQLQVVAPAPEAPSANCSHRRSKSRARPGDDGLMRSVSRFCGAPMRRRGSGDWYRLMGRLIQQVVERKSYSTSPRTACMFDNGQGAIDV